MIRYHERGDQSSADDTMKTKSLTSQLIFVQMLLYSVDKLNLHVYLSS